MKTQASPIGRRWRYGKIAFVFGVLLAIGGSLVAQERMFHDFLRRANSDYLDPLYSTSLVALSPKNQIPLHHYFDNMEILNSKIQENINFHQRGGNLKMYQEFLDNAIDSTLRKYDTTFIPKPTLPQGGQNITNVTEYLKHHYMEHTSPRRGYGEPLPGRFQKATSPLFYERRWVDIIEPRESKAKWDVGLGPIGPKCSDLIQLGATNDAGDGGKSMCLPNTKNNKNECHVISVGGNDNWVFETAMVDTMNCTTYTFDCTLPDGIPKNKPDTDQMKFFNYCISGGDTTDSPDQSNDSAKYLTYQQASELAGLTVAPIYFKIDVEGFEYDVFTNMLQTTPYDMLPMQIQVELHWNTRMTDLPWMLRNRNVGEILLLSNIMFSIGGYIPIEYDFNPYCASCMEVLYFRAATPATTALPSTAAGIAS